MFDYIKQVTKLLIYLILMVLPAMIIAHAFVEWIKT